jgi:hypothetical protein
MYCHFQIHYYIQCEKVSVYEGVGKGGCLTEDRIVSLYRAMKGGKLEEILPSVTYPFFRLLRANPLLQCGVLLGEVEDGVFLRKAAMLLYDHTAS